MKEPKTKNKAFTPGDAENKSAAPVAVVAQKETMNALAILTLFSANQLTLDGVHDAVREDLSHLNERQRIEALKLLVSNFSTISQRCGQIIAILPKD